MGLYSIQCIDFTKFPEFTLEVNCVNETENYFTELVHDIGIKLKTNATCTQLTCTRFGFFHSEHALLRRCWNAQHIINNMGHCWELGNPEFFKPSSPTLKPNQYVPLKYEQYLEREQKKLELQAGSITNKLL